VHLRYGDLSLYDIAAQDSLFLRHEFRLASTIKNLERTYCIFDLSTALIARLQHLSSSNGLRYVGDENSCGDFMCDKFVANLEHLLRCLRQIALDVIVYHCIGLVEAHILHWYDYWQHQKRIDEGWFAEWPNGQRPLSTTWPWNVKPALLVLWGVCWMFYGQNSTPTSFPRETRNRRGAAQRGELSGDFRTRQLESQSQPVPQALPTGLR